MAREQSLGSGRRASSKLRRRFGGASTELGGFGGASAEHRRGIGGASVEPWLSFGGASAELGGGTRIRASITVRARRARQCGLPLKPGPERGATGPVPP
jgi:hypothetical protein